MEENKQTKSAKNITIEDVEKGVGIFTKVWETVKSILGFFKSNKRKTGDKQ